jgi:hypothetical protein
MIFILFQVLLGTLKKRDGQGMWYESERGKINRILAVKSEKINTCKI